MKHNFFKFLLAGMVLLGTSINLWAWEGTFYCVPKAMWGDDWSSSKTVKLNVRRGDGNDNWVQQTMSGTGRYYKGNEIYSTTVTTFWYDHCGNVQFQRYNGSTQEHSWEAYGDWQELSYFNSRLFPGNAGWQDYKTDPVINYAHLYYTKNGGSTDYKFDGDKSDFDLGTITSSFTVTNIYLNFNKNGGNVCATKDNGAMCYKVNNGTNTTRLQPTSGWTWSGTKDPYELQWTNASKTIASSTDPSGKYTLHIWWELKGDYAGESNCTDVTWYYSNSGKNYNWTYTILPPAVSNFSVSATSGNLSGEGMQAKPYLVKYGTSLTLRASGSQAHSDANSSLQVKYGSASYSGETTKTISNIISSSSIKVKAKFYNSSAKLSGSETEEKTIYYQAVYTDLSAADNGCTMQSPSTISPTQIEVGKSVTVTAGTPATGYHFTGWTSENGTFSNANALTTTFTPSSNNAVAVANWEEDVKYTITYPNESNFALTKGAEESLSGQTISFTVTANTGFQLTEVSAKDATQATVSLSKDGDTYSFTMPASNVTITVVASYINYIVAMNATTGGTITTPVSVPAGGTTNYTTAHYNVAFGITAVEATGYHFTGWTKTENITISEAGNLSTQATLTDVDNTKTITANFEANTYTVHFNANTGEGEMADEDFTYNVSKALTANSFTKTGYDFKGWAETAGGAVKYTDKQSVRNLTEANNGIVNLYAVWAPHAYTITYKDEGNIAYSGENLASLPTTHTYDTPTNLVAGTKTGYTFQGWYKEQNCSGSKVTTIGAQEITANITLYAKWDINTYTISYPQTTEHYTISNDKTVQGQFGSTASFSITPEDGYRVYVTITYGSSQSVTYSHARDAKEYSFNIPAGNVTVNVEVQRYQIGGTFNSWGDKYDFDLNHSLVLNLEKETRYEFKLYNELYKTENISNDGYVGFNGDWNIYESMQNGKMTYAGNNSFFLYTGAAGNYTITIGNVDNVPAISVTYPDVKEVVILHSNPAENEHLTFTNVSGDIWETSASSELSKSVAHQFRVYWNGTWYSQEASEHDGHDQGHNMTPGDHTNWTMYKDKREVNLWLTPFNKTNSPNSPYRFRFNASTKQLTVIYPSFITGTMNSWGFTPLTFVNNVATYDYESDGSQFMYKIIDDGNYYGKVDETEIAASTSFNLTNADGNKDVVVKPNGAGTYTINYDQSTKQCQVNFPDNTKYDVTVYYDGVTKTETQAGPSGGIGIRAVDKPGYRFAGWDISESPENTVRIADINAQSTTLYCDEDGGIVRATYSNDKFIYFKNTTNWGNVYVQFYPSDKIYMDDSKGTGTCKNGENSNEALVNAMIYTMTHIDKTDIWYYDCSGFWDNINSPTLAFTSDKQDNHKYFDNCDVVYRGDFSKENTNLFVPENFIHRYLNKHDQDKKHYEAHYYDRGYWLKYQDTHSGWKVEVYDVKTGDATETKAEELISKTPGNYTYQATINLTKGETYEYGMKLHNMYNGLYMSYAGTITSANCTNRKGWYETVSENCVLTADGNGDYLFTVTFSNGEVTMSVGYPPSNGDWRVIATKDAKTYETGYTYKPEANKKDTASFFVTEGSTIVLQKLNGGTVGNPNWDNVQTITNPTAGIMNYLITQGADGTTATLTEIGEYKGDFYIRTDGVDGGWDGFLTNDDNLMTNYGSLLSDGNGFQYDFYKTKWVESGKNVKFRIANKYNKYLSADSETDSYISSEQNLQQSANVRFMWNSEDNTLKRAYLSGSTLSKDRFLVLLGNTYMDEQVARPYMFDENGNEITAGGEAEDDPRKGLNAHELLMKDKNNWVYQVDIKAIPSCAVKLTAAYNGKVQYFIGTTSTSADGYKTIISGNGTDKYTMRVVYDFKTNLLIAGWVPDDKEIGEQISLGGDMLISRTHQDDAQQIRFGTGGSIEDIHHVYSVLTIKKDVMLGKDGTEYTTAATNTDYERTMYWISFPFDVKISEVFGVDGYGKKWIMQRYNGEKRAEIGWFQETETFWEYLAPTSTLKAYKGYLLILNANYFNTDGADVWKNSATEANFYFPSAEKNIGIINKSSVDIDVHAHECGIDRLFADDSKKNHTITDSYWNVIGVPAFQDAQAAATLAEGCNLKSYYKWKSEDNTYEAETTMDGMTFKTMHAYMVQFGGTLTWESVSVVNNPTTAPYHYADAKNYRIELFFNGNGAEDHTYINLADGAHTDFELNEDMMKIDNAGQPNIYSFAGAYDVAYNETKMENQSVMLGVSAPKNGSYTFAMPKDFSGKAVLVDLESGEATDLNLSNYTVELNKGTYNNRFQLLLEVEAKAPTNMRNVDSGLWNVDGKTKKLFINDNIYLINAGRIYNVLGVGE